MSPRPLSRRELVAAGAVAALAPLLAGPSAALAEADTDAAILQSLVGLEQVSAFAYAAAARSSELDEDLVPTAERFARHEQEHGDALLTALEAIGAPAPPPPRSLADVDRILPGFGDVRSSEDIVLFAIELETAAVAAYHDAQTKLEDPKLLQTCLSIMANEGQHLAVLRAALDQQPVPNAFETGER